MSAFECPQTGQTFRIGKNLNLDVGLVVPPVADLSDGNQNYQGETVVSWCQAVRQNQLPFALDQKQYVKDAAKLFKFTPQDVGCTSFDACEFSVTTAKQDSKLPCGSGGVGGDKFAYDVVLLKTKYDDALRRDCCMGKYSITDDINHPDFAAKWCDPVWCTSDPASSCSDIARETCAASDPFCEKSSMLVPHDFDTARKCTADGSSCYDPYELQFCHKWYESAQQAQHPSQKILAEMVESYCRGGPGAARGECACYNSLIEIHGDQVSMFRQGAPEAYRAATASPPRDVFIGQMVGAGNLPTARRFDLYCTVTSSGRSQKFGSFSSQTRALYDTYCRSGPQSINGQKPSINPTPNSPSALLGLPVHCWNPDCQPEKDTCLFWDPTMFDMPCPDICMQLSAGNKINVNDIDTSGQIMINGMVQNCNVSPDSKKPLPSAFKLDYARPGDGENVLEIDACQAPNQTQEIVFTLTNQASDSQWG